MMLSKWENQYCPDSASSSEIGAIGLMLLVPVVILLIGKLGGPDTADVVMILALLMGAPAIYFAIALTLTSVALSFLLKELRFAQAVTVLRPIVIGIVILQILLSILIFLWNRQPFSLWQFLSVTFFSTLLLTPLGVSFLRERDEKTTIIETVVGIGGLILGYYIFQIFMQGASQTKPSLIMNSFRWSLLTLSLCSILVLSTFITLLVGRLHFAMWIPRTRAYSIAGGTAVLPLLFLYGLIYVAMIL